MLRTTSMSTRPTMSPSIFGLSHGRLTLIVFTAITVALSYVDFGTQKANVAVAMLVATFKAGLVAAIFMHLSAEKRMIYRILIFTGFFVFGLFWLTYLAWYDPIAR